VTVKCSGRSLPSTTATTLIKIMLGLLEPTRGEVLIDGIPLSVLGARAYREQVAAVMQDDQLSGSIADNICFFDSSFDQQQMIQCASLARIHDEIMTMPMTYNSLIGDMGSSLSGGQKQRVLLTRALYREPRIPSLMNLLRASANRLSACGRALRPWLWRTPLPAAVLDPSGQASPAGRPPCRTAGAGFTAARALDHARRRA
jgi:ABC-type transport system involved in Fe-S cluster assembly fused permease/ATPase subunit